MYLSLQNTDDDTITSIITPMNLFTNDELPFNREEGVQDQLQERFAKQLKIIEEVKKKQQRDVKSLIRQRIFKAEKVKSQVKLVRRLDGEHDFGSHNKKNLMTDEAAHEHAKWLKKRGNGDGNEPKKKTEKYNCYANCLHTENP